MYVYVPMNMKLLLFVTGAKEILFRRLYSIGKCQDFFVLVYFVI